MSDSLWLAFLTVFYDLNSFLLKQSSSALPYILKNLAKNPTKQQQLFDEIMKVFPDKDSKITEESIKSIPFLNGFILESLRVDSPIKYLKRTLDQDLKIENFS